MIFSRETNSTLTNDFDPNTADMNLTDEGEISLPWNDFLNYTLFEVESRLQNLNVAWVIGGDNPFPAMRANGGAIGGVEFGVEPQTNNPDDQSYTLQVNKFLVEVNDVESGLLSMNDSPDNQPPTISFSVPSFIDAGDLISGTASDVNSAVTSVQYLLRDLSDFSYLDLQGNTIPWGPDEVSSLTNGDSVMWDIPSNDLSPGRYRLYIRAFDTADNVSTWTNTDFIITSPDNQPPTTAFSCLLYTSPSPRDRQKSRMPSSA